MAQITNKHRWDNMKEALEKIKKMIVTKDPNDDDKFLREIWDLCNVALEELEDMRLEAKNE